VRGGEDGGPRDMQRAQAHRHAEDDVEEVVHAEVDARPAHRDDCHRGERGDERGHPARRSARQQ
jgi:hypothetical protein